MKGKLIWLDEKSYGTALNEYNELIAKKESLQKKLNEIIGNDDTNILDLYPSIELNFFNTSFIPGHYLYADLDGLLVSKTKIDIWSYVKDGFLLW